MSLDTLLDGVHQAIATRTPLRIRGGNSKAFLGRPIAGTPLDTRVYSGIVRYDPTELVVTARAGTPLVELLAALDEAGQMLPCEPPDFDGQATVGGMVAAGLSGPRRPWSGAVRDFVLGTRVISGLGQHLRFGGEVLKNVAGYDLSRLLAGSLGSLGVLTEVSLKVLPTPRCSASLNLDISAAEALQRLAEWGQQALPISGACHDGQVLHLRLEGGAGSVAAACDRLGCSTVAGSFWADLREQRLPFFHDPRPLWRLSLPFNVGELAVPGLQLLDWAGAQRWLKSDVDAALLRSQVAAVGGHATCFNAAPGDSPFHPLAPTLLRYQQRLKAHLDPHGLFNPGRLYPEL
ncbi:glycolate oxidase FAD binding subunit [Pseudomonas sp. M47T1]|uniref:glycolate oxidase subunit GlcE n=1 Tax=unclassified Pseudomonas TaxID=196821 RepID=UPI00026082B5|nr:glycolate oxidase subunit GlcE [Pseudomonas sp. M47T1]EIK97257.1 glycolate oxidase FAD binding subunit [Pseudomonas sp. M47T1]